MAKQLQCDALAGPCQPSQLLQNRQSAQRACKWRRVLAALMTGRSFNRFEAERELHDHCLHSTVAGLQRKGIPIYRAEESVPGYQGAATRVCRYWLPPEAIKPAYQLLCNADGRTEPLWLDLCAPALPVEIRHELR